MHFSKILKLSCKTLFATSLVGAAALLNSACSAPKFPFSTNLKKSLDDFNDSYIKKFSQGSSSSTVSSYLQKSQNKAIFFQEALNIFGYNSKNQFLNNLTVSDSIFTNNLKGTNLTSWGKDALERSQKFKSIIGDIYCEYAGLILITAASYKYQAETTINDLSENLSDFSQSFSYLGQYFYYLESNSIYNVTLFSSNFLRFWSYSVIANFKDSHLNYSYLYKLFTEDFSKNSELLFNFDNFQADGRYPNQIANVPVNYSFGVTFNKKIKFNFSFQFAYNRFAIATDHAYYQDLNVLYEIPS